MTLKKPASILPFLLIIIAAAAFAAYFNSLGGKFIWDEYALIKENPSIKSFANLTGLFTGPLGEDTVNRFSLYRPAQMLTYMIDYHFYGFSEPGYHLTNIILHILTALAFFWLVALLSGNNLPAAFFGSSLFALHPIHTEAVSYIAGRAEPLSSLFIVLSFVFYIKALSSKSAAVYFLAFMSYIIALFAKEYSLVLPLLILLYHYAFRKPCRMREFAPVLAISAVYMFTRAVTGQTVSSRLPQLAGALERLPGFFVAVANYLRLLILPFDLRMEYGKTIFNFTDPAALAGLSLSFLILYAATAKRDKHRLVFFSAAWFFTALLPYTNLFPVDAYMAEHWLYVPSMGFFILLGLMTARLWSIKKYRIFAMAFFVTVGLFYACLTVRQNGYWKDGVTFAVRTLKFAPRSVNMYNLLASHYADAGRYEEAIAIYKKINEIAPGYAIAYYSLGLIHGHLGRKGEADAYFKKAAAINPVYSSPRQR